MVGIYKITSPSGKIYIGQGIDLKRRFKEHKDLNKTKKHPRLHNSFIKYGIESHSFEVILECNIEDLNKYERHYQELYNVTDKNGLNCLLTKEGDRSGSFSEYTRLKMSESKKGKKLSKEATDRRVELYKNKVISEETRKKMSEAQKGHHRGIGRKFSEETKLKMSNARNKKEIIDTSTGIIYTSYVQASIFTGMNCKTLWNQLTGISKNKTNLILIT